MRSENQPPPPARARPSASAAGVAWLTLALFPAAAAAFLAWRMPLGSWGAGIAGIYAALLLWRPVMWLALLPALLPVFDLAPRTGWYFLNELDLLVLITAACGYARLGPLPCAPLPRAVVLPFTALLLVWTGSAVAGLASLGTLGLSDLADYRSPLNAMRVWKGIGWAALLLPLFERSAGSGGANVRRLFVPGTLIGLAATCFAIVWERGLFVGVLNFSTEYRPTALFSSMHTGGAALDAYLALALPFVAFLLVGKEPYRLMTGLALAVLTVYASLTTFSRCLWLAMAISLLVGAAAYKRRLSMHAMLAMALLWPAHALGYRALALLLGLAAAASAIWIRVRPQQKWKTLRMFGVAVLVACAVPIVGGSYASERASTVSRDLSSRIAHWRDVLHMIDSRPGAQWLGLGLGRFPENYLWLNQGGEVPGSFRFDGHLTLTSPRYRAGYGEMLRVEQTLDGAISGPMSLTLTMRRSANTHLHAAVCERWLLYPANCRVIPLRLPAPDGAWRAVRSDFALSVRQGWSGPPIVFELAADAGIGTIDIGAVSLRDASHELVRNGDFARGFDYWFFTSDRFHLPWHIKNMMVNALFETGWIGAAALLTLLVCFARYLGQAPQQPGRSIYFASLAGVLTVGLFDSVFDTPRLTLAFFLFVFAASAGHGQEDAETGARAKPAVHFDPAP